VASKLQSLFNTTPFVLIVSPPGNDPAMAQAALGSGADALKLHCNLTHPASGLTFGSFAEERDRLREVVGVAEGVPVGVVPGAQEPPSKSDLLGLIDLGVDFVDFFARFFPAWAFMALKSFERVGKMVAVDQEWNLDQIQALEHMGFQFLEAACVPESGYGAFLSAKDIVDYKIMAESVAIPVIVPTQRKISPDEVGALREIGVRGIAIGAVVTGMETSGVERATRAFRDAIDSAL
jgi:hypothetical protein